MEKGFDIRKEFANFGIDLPPKRVHFKIPDAELAFKKTMGCVLRSISCDYKHLTPYNNVIAWMKNNNGLGLLLMGRCGNGKTVIAKYVLPYIFQKMFKKKFKVFDASTFRSIDVLDELEKYRYIVIDDIGVENTIVEYGNKVDVFARFMDIVEKQNKLIILTTNLDASSLEERYGTRVADRLANTTKIVGFNEKSFRR